MKVWNSLLEMYLISSGLLSDTSPTERVEERIALPGVDVGYAIYVEPSNHLAEGDGVFDLTLGRFTDVPTNVEYEDLVRERYLVQVQYIELGFVKPGEWLFICVAEAADGENDVPVERLLLIGLFPRVFEACGPADADDLRSSQLVLQCISLEDNSTLCYAVVRCSGDVKARRPRSELLTLRPSGLHCTIDVLVEHLFDAEHPFVIEDESILGRDDTLHRLCAWAVE